jgi:hypothetical protein
MLGVGRKLAAPAGGFGRSVGRGVKLCRQDDRYVLYARDSAEAGLALLAEGFVGVGLVGWDFQREGDMPVSYRQALYHLRRYDITL